METARLPGPEPGRRRHWNRRLTGAAWGLLLVWVGLALLAQVGWGFGLLGVGVIVLGAQAVHVAAGGQRVDVFSAVVGALFLLGGIWELFSIQVALVPILCIVTGLLLLASALRPRPEP